MYADFCVAYLGASVRTLTQYHTVAVASRFSHSIATQEEELKDAILLIFANKQDQKGAYNAAQITEAMELSKIKNRQWSIQETAAIKGQGMFEGFDWLVTCIKGE